jgi:hypothetical protein
MKKDIIIVENFYEDPLKVREYALNELKNNYYAPYGNSTWYASKFKEWNECPFKSSEFLINRLNDITNEEIDLDFWRKSYPPHGSKEDSIRGDKSCKWNCSFHNKPLIGQKLGQGVHNHVTDTWNSVEENGWVGLIYLNPEAPIDTGLFLWENKDQQKNYDWMTPEENWKLIDSLGAVFNRLILCRGSKPHSGSDGFSNTLEEGRLYQTFFFKTKPSTFKSYPSVSIDIK